MTDPTAMAGDTEQQRDIRMNKDIAAFSYVWVMSVIIFFSRKDSKFIQYHSKQGIVLFLLSIPIALIPFIGKLLLLVLVGAMILGFVNAAQGKYEDIPIIGDLAKGNVKFHDIIQGFAKLMEKIASLFRDSFKKPGSGSASPDSPDTTHSTPPVDTPPPPPVL